MSGAKHYSVSRTINASPEVVWALLTDASTYHDWNPAVISISGTMAVGSTVELVSVADPKRTFRPRVTTLEPPERMVWSDGMPLGLFRGTRTFLLSRAEARTEFSMTEEFAGPLSGLITRSIPDLTASFEQFADGLRSAAERVAARGQHS